MTDQTVPATGDFVRVASCETPTEAHLLQSVLTAAGLERPQVADANIMRVNPWLASALGGVRVLVRSSEAALARETIARFNAGEFVLEGEDLTPAPLEEQPRLLFNPDLAFLLGFVLTPAFGPAIQLSNAYTMRAGRTGHWGWFIALTAFSLLAVLGIHAEQSHPLLVFQASLGIAGLNCIWYLFFGRNQSKGFIARFGAHYRRKRQRMVALRTALALLAIGCLLSAFA
ncbi:hypothetical protein ACQ859_27765 [Roseateles chitinivorans]|uniref:hypothetical protein n=1 Tax=Roseateles chitinivorans TaxID=2917965 RepID=UPI003D66CB62